MPRPVVTDLLGQGQTHIILITNTLHLQVAEPPTAEPTSPLPHLNTLHSHLLAPLSDEEGRSSFPVALETGYLQELKEANQHRPQVIVVLFDNWEVLCFNHNLTLIWRQQLMDVGHIRDTYDVKAMGILITPHSLVRGDGGTIIIGGSFAHKHSHAGHVPDEKHQAGSTDNTYTHFSTFALSGNDGTTRWHHLPGEFHHTPQQEAHHWKLSLRRGQWHVGEVHWTKYTHSLLTHMPHRWRSLQDTSMDIAELSKLEKRRLGSSDKEMEHSAIDDLLGLDGPHIIGRPYGGMVPHSCQEHVKHPNAVIIHHHRGIEVLSLDTGRPLTRLEMPQQHAVYADVDSDGTLERVRLHHDVGNCYAEAVVVSPRTRMLYSKSVCDSISWWGSPAINHINEDTRQAITPVLIPSVARRSGLLNHVLGKNLVSEQRGYDSLYLTSTGLLTSFSPSGDLNWQVSVPDSGWSSQAERWQHGGHGLSAEERDIFEHVFNPSLVTLALQIYGKQTTALVSGWNSISLVDIREGRFLSEHSLPCQPTHEPVIADFTGDGLNDVIISCPIGYLGLSLQRSLQYRYLVAAALSVGLLMAVLAGCCSYLWDDDEDAPKPR